MISDFLTSFPTAVIEITCQMDNAHCLPCVTLNVTYNGKTYGDTLMGTFAVADLSKYLASIFEVITSG